MQFFKKRAIVGLIGLFVSLISYYLWILKKYSLPNYSDEYWNDDKFLGNK